MTASARTLTVPINIDRKDIGDLWATAVDGGINYWVKKVKIVGLETLNGKSTHTALVLKPEYANISDYLLGPEVGEIYAAPFSVNRRVIIEVEDHEVDGSNLFELTSEKLEAAFKHPRAASIIAQLVRDQCPDAGEADVFVQLALFGEVVFG